MAKKTIGALQQARIRERFARMASQTPRPAPQFLQNFLNQALNSSRPNERPLINLYEAFPRIKPTAIPSGAKTVGGAGG